MVNGIDTASYQGSPNWSAVAKAGYEFAYVKASEGSSSSYPSAAPQFIGAMAAGLATGLYCYAQPSLTPQVNAAAFAAQVNRLCPAGGNGRVLPPCLDLEVGSGQLGSWAMAFFTELRRLTGYRRVMLYSGYSFFTTQIGETELDADVMLWLARYNNTPGTLGYTSPRLALHQFSQSGVVPGITGNVDLDFAIWPLAKLIGSDDMTPEEHAMLVATYQFVSGSAEVVPAGTDWPGWPTWPGGTNEDLTATDLLRRANVQLAALAAAVDALRPKLGSAGGIFTSLSQADVNRIAAAVVALQAVSKKG